MALPTHSSQYDHPPLELDNEGPVTETFDQLFELSSEEVSRIRVSVHELLNAGHTDLLRILDTAMIWEVG